MGLGHIYGLVWGERESDRLLSQIHTEKGTVCVYILDPGEGKSRGKWGLGRAGSVWRRKGKAMEGGREIRENMEERSFVGKSRKGKTRFRQ